MIWTYYNSFFVPNKRYGYFLSTDTFWFDVGQVFLSKPFVKVEYFLTFSGKSHISTRRWWQIFENLFSKCSFEDQYIKIDETDCKWSQTFQIFISIKMLIVHSIEPFLSYSSFSWPTGSFRPREAFRRNDTSISFSLSLPYRRHHGDETYCKLGQRVWRQNGSAFMGHRNSHSCSNACKLNWLFHDLTPAILKIDIFCTIRSLQIWTLYQDACSIGMCQFYR